MTLRDFSLISVLYDAKGSGLYKDVYFPIIKYSLVSLFRKDETKEYYDVEDLKAYIQEVFGLSIPTIVLKRVVETIHNNKDFVVTSYKDDLFRIERLWDCTEYDDIEEKAKRFHSSVELLESTFAEYVTKSCHQESITFLQFISDNTEDILGFFENEDASKVDEKYAIITDFLQYIHATNTPLYDVANKLFWGSIIAGFLKREDPPITHSDTKEVYEYFLDTSIAMALLDLSTTIKKQYAEELLSIINKSGGVLYLHPITKLEIYNIIQSVEDAQNPYPMSDIASAYERRRLSPSKLATIRSSITTDLAKMGIVITPSVRDESLKDNIRRMQCDKYVDLLYKMRAHTNYNISIDDSQDLVRGNPKFREIHDVYMMNYIEKRQGELHRDTIRFITLNKDLISFANQCCEKTGLMTHPYEIMINLWMHNSISSKETNFLTEALTRCQLLQESSARRKLSLVAKYYNERTEGFNPEAYKAVILSLYKRERNVVRYIDEVCASETERSKETNQELVRKACDAAINAYSMFKDANEGLQESIRQLQLSQDETKVQLAAVQKELECQSEVIKSKDNAIRQHKADAYIDHQRHANREKIQRFIIDKQRVVGVYKNQLHKVEMEISDEEKEMQNSVCLVKYWIQLTWLTICIVLLCYIIIDIVINGLSKMSIIGVIPIAQFAWVLINGYWLSPRIYYQIIKKEQIEYKKENNKNYKKLISQKSELKELINKLEDEIASHERYLNTTIE